MSRRPSSRSAMAVFSGTSTTALDTAPRPARPGRETLPVHRGRLAAADLERLYLADLVGRDDLDHERGAGAQRMALEGRRQVDPTATRRERPLRERAPATVADGLHFPTVGNAGHRQL